MEEVRDPETDALTIYVSEELHQSIVGYTDLESKYWCFTPDIQKHLVENMQSTFGNKIQYGYAAFDYIQSYLFDNSVEIQLVINDKKYAVEIIIHGDPYSDDEHIAVLTIYETLGLNSLGQPKQLTPS